MPNRIIALIVDGIVLTAIGAVLSLLLGGLTTENTALDGSGGGLDVGRFMLVAVIDAAISLAYFGLGWRLLQGTPGMWLLGLRIVDESGVGDISWAHVLVRWLLLGVPWILAGFSVYVQDRVALVLAVAGVAWLLLLLYTMAQSSTKQGLHDRYAHTIVVKARRRAA